MGGGFAALRGVDRGRGRPADVHTKQRQGASEVHRPALELVHGESPESFRGMSEVVRVSSVRHLLPLTKPQHVFAKLIWLTVRLFVIPTPSRIRFK
jgi:hypothetical protein